MGPTGLDENPDANIRVYAVWFSMLGADARQKWEDDLMTDPRVTQWWDEEKEAGRFFAGQEEFMFGSVAYDIYYLYGQEAQWDVKPSPLVSSGYTVMAKREQLKADVLRLLGF